MQLMSQGLQHYFAVIYIPFNTTTLDTTFIYIQLLTSYDKWAHNCFINFRILMSLFCYDLMYLTSW